MVTRPRPRAARLARALEAHGARVIVAPAIRAAEPDDWGPVDLAIQRLAQYQWIVVTSAHGVDAFVRRLMHRERDVRDLHGIRLAAIGRKTAGRLREMGLRADVVPDEYRAEALAEELVSAGVAGRNVLVPRSAVARPTLVDELRAAGAFVDEVHTYTIEPETELEPEVAEAMAANEEGIDLLTFTSSSTVETFMGLAEGSGLHDRLRLVPAACIGPITAETAEELGLHTMIVAEEYTIEGLVAAIVEAAEAGWNPGT